ncbi:hypothetical protein PMAYCL1PPCAC_23945 [Pristionchus mayeri]|uniref:G protein-coupled receptor n=1 Tax=Pristionchus mayeri TaxID=1317129 RepID=A0AAN5D0F2_9BILA|nr:hypothetical protein PMAYCL1PPCAC_23945 [Pristionchus mayeri]
MVFFLVEGFLLILPIEIEASLIVNSRLIQIVQSRRRDTSDSLSESQAKVRDERQHFNLLLSCGRLRESLIDARKDSISQKIVLIFTNLIDRPPIQLVLSIGSDHMKHDSKDLPG